MRVFRWLGRFTLIAGPLLVLLVCVLVAFLMWVLVTAPGTRWALTTAVDALDGRIEAVEGSVWKGLRVGDVSLDLPGVALRLENLELRADWRALLERRLYIRTLQAETVWVDLSETPASEDEDQGEEGFKQLELPVTVRADHVAVGELILTQDGQPLPMTLQNFSAALAIGPETGQLILRRLQVATDSLDAGFKGDFNVHALQHPWPSDIELDVTVNGLRPGAPVCFQQMLPTLPGGASPIDPISTLLTGVAAGSCPLEVQARAQGSLEAVSVSLSGSGQGMTLDAAAQLEPSQAMPLRMAELALDLPDGSSLKANAGWEASAVPANNAVLVGEISAQRLDAGQLAGGLIPAAVLGFDGGFRIVVDEAQTVRGGALNLSFHEGSHWNEKALAGKADVAVSIAAHPEPHPQPQPEPQPGPGPEPQAQPHAQPGSQSQPPSQPATASASSLIPAELLDLAVHRLNLDVQLGENRIHTEGGFGSNQSRLNLDVQAPHLADFWPDLPGGLTVKGHISGALAEHAVDLALRYVPENATTDEIGTAPISVALKADGAWGGQPEGWRGRLQSLQVDHAHLGLTLGAPLALAFHPHAVAPEWQWTAGPTELGFSVNGQRVVSARHEGSRGGAGRWETDGRIDRLLVSPQALRQFGADFDIAALRDDGRGGVKVRGARAADDWEMILGLDWSLRFDGVPQGRVQLRHLSGDIMVPAESPFPLELETFDIDLTLTPANAGTSRLDADVNLVSRRMGRVAASATMPVHVTADGGIVLDPDDRKTVTVDASMADLGWTSLLVGDALEIGGAVQANIELQSRPDGSWASAGTIQGTDLRVVMIDQGVRLLDGTLQARMDGDRLVLERLEFPARLRAEPKEWRTSEWVNTNPDAKGGWLRISGDWNLVDSTGIIDAELYRFPILQRADRYAMMTGALKLDVALPDLDITGKLTADAGWFDLDMLGGIPTVDSDVVVIRAGEKPAPEVPLGITLDLEIDLGPRFYLTGYGLNSGLVGSMRIIMRDGKLSGLGSLRTRGGAIEAYGQRLQLRRGAITFQGDITRPVLDIEALRTGLAVEAGVRVGGNARKPRIELVSYPAVSEIEKLSWLLLGHGPNDSGGDMALLFSVGTSFLSDGEPFYRRFGIDEVSLRSGEIGSVASVLPVESVVRSLDSGTSDIERRFINVSKRLSSGVTLSVRQALSDTGTVARASYRLARGLTVEASVGTISGLALVYRWFSRERQPESQQ